MDFLELCRRRESCRSYTGAPVGDEDLRKIVEAGRLSPSACNSQPWKFYVANGGEHADAVRRGVQWMGNNKFTDKAAAFIVVFGAKECYSERIGEALFGREFSSIDVGIAAANMVLCAASLGLGTCILGMFKDGEVKEALGLSPKDKSVIKLVISVGVPATDKPRDKKRKTTDEIAVFMK